MKKDILSKLENAQTKEEREWIVMEFSLNNLSSKLRNAVWAAAIPHWFDFSFLNTLLDEPLNEETFKELTSLSFIEIFPERGYNIHEKTREIILNRLWKFEHKLFLRYSKKANSYCLRQEQTGIIWQIEAIYHALLAGYKKATTHFIEVGVDWHNNSKNSEIELLIHPVLNSIISGRISGQVAAWTYYRQAKLEMYHSKPLEARVHLELALEQKTNDWAIKGQCIFALSQIHMQKDEYENAKSKIEEARSIFKKGKSLKGKANCLLLLAGIDIVLGEYENAKLKLHEALFIFNAIDSKLGIASCYNGLGKILFFLNEYEDARSKFQKSISIDKLVGNRLGIANSTAWQGDIDTKLSEYKDAKSKYNEAISIYKAIGTLGGEASCIKGLGDVNFYMSEYEEAKTKCEKALSIFLQIGDLHQEADTLLSLGLIFRGLNEREKGEEYLIKSMSIFKKIKVPKYKEVQSHLSNSK